MYNSNTRSDSDSEVDTVENNNQSENPAVVELFSVFEERKREWELLDCDVDNIIKEIADVNNENGLNSNNRSFDEIASLIEKNNGVEINDIIVTEAIEEADMREYKRPEEIDDCRKALYLMKKKGEMRSVKEVAEVLDTEKKSYLNPRVLLMNTYRSIMHLLNRVSEQVTNRNEKMNIGDENDSR